MKCASEFTCAHSQASMERGGGGIISRTKHGLQPVNTKLINVSLILPVENGRVEKYYADR